VKKSTRLTISLLVGTPMYDYYYSFNERQRSIIVHEALTNHFLLKTGQLQQPSYPPQPVYQFPPMAYPGWPAVAPAPAAPPVAPVAPPAAPQQVPSPVAQVAPVAAPAAPVVAENPAPVQAAPIAHKEPVGSAPASSDSVIDEDQFAEFG